MIAIDLFAGLGGFTEGARLAGIHVAWAANHWQAAVDCHAANHPTTTHVCQDLRQFDFGQVPDHDLALMSPCCQGHSRARTRGNVTHDASRATAWAVVSLLEAKRPALAIVENVEEFQRWALFPAWQLAISALGYSLAPHVLDAADSGVPQHRRRLFLVLSRSRSLLLLRAPNRQHVPAATIIDWDAHKWTKINVPGRAQATLDRVASGRKTIGDRFLMSYYSRGSGLVGRPLTRPIGTITTRDRWAIVDGDRMRMLQPDEVRAAMSFPAAYQLPASKKLAVHLLGNAVCPLQAESIIRAVLEAA